MSLWFLTSAAALAINAQLVRLYNPETEIIYFGAIGGLSIILRVILYFMAPKIQVLMRGIK